MRRECLERRGCPAQVRRLSHAPNYPNVRLMLIHPRGKDRLYHLGPFPLEALRRDDGRDRARGATPAAGGHGRRGAGKGRWRAPPSTTASCSPNSPTARWRRSGRRCRTIRRAARSTSRAPPISSTPPRRAFAACRTTAGSPAPIVRNTPSRPSSWSSARACRSRTLWRSDWIAPARATIADMRAAEIARLRRRPYPRTWGFAARAHFAGDSLLDAERLAVLAGLAVRERRTGRAIPISAPISPLAVVIDRLRARHRRAAARRARCSAKGLAYWWGINGAQSGRERNRQSAARDAISARYPMEQVKRVERPTTLILDDEVPRVPKRAAFFQRALHGDLGDKAKTERTRFAFKTPLSSSAAAGDPLAGAVPGRRAVRRPTIARRIAIRPPMPAPSSRCPMRSAPT